MICSKIVLFQRYIVVPASKLIFCRRIPNVTVSTDEGDVELEISDDPHDCRRLDISSIPVTVTLSKVR